jgi:hypothetical protein
MSTQTSAPGVVYLLHLGIGWQLARVWRGPRALERSLKQRGTARRCPICHLTRLGLAPGRPADLLAFELGARAAGLAPGEGVNPACLGSRSG